LHNPDNFLKALASCPIPTSPRLFYRAIIFCFGISDSESKWLQLEKKRRNGSKKAEKGVEKVVLAIMGMAIVLAIAVLRMNFIYFFRLLTI